MNYYLLIDKVNLNYAEPGSDTSMNSTINFFKFHDIATIRILSDSAFANTFFTAEYKYHHSAQPLPETKENVLQTLEPFELLPHLDFEFHQNTSAPKGFTRTSHKILARWSYRIDISPATINIQVNGNQPSVSMVHHMLVHSSLRYLACQNQNLLLHAGAVVKNNKSLIFTGKGGTGKTTITSLILAADRGWQIHADDYIFLGNGQSKAYITRSHLYRDLKRWIPRITSCLTWWEKLRLEIFGEIRKDSHDRIKWPVRIEPLRLWPKASIADTAKPAALFLLEREDISRPSVIRLNDLDEITESLAEMNFGEAHHYINLLQKSGSLDEDWLLSWKETELRLISKKLREIPVYRLVLPYSGSPSEIQSNLLTLLDEFVM